LTTWTRPSGEIDENTDEADVLSPSQRAKLKLNVREAIMKLMPILEEVMNHIDPTGEYNRSE
jgi:hypothetical protein